MHGRIKDANVFDPIENAIVVILCELGLFCFRGKMDVHNFAIEKILYEKIRMLGEVSNNEFP